MPKGSQPASVEEVDLKTAPTSKPSAHLPTWTCITEAKFKFAVDSMYGSGRGVLTGIFRERGMQHVAIRAGTESAVSRHQSRAHRAARRTAAGNGGRERCHAGLRHRRRRRPHRRRRRRRQLRGFAQDFLRAAAAGCWSARSGRETWCAPSTPPACSTASPPSTGASCIECSDRLQVHCRPHDGARDPDRRRGIRRHRLLAAFFRSATAC